MKKALSIVLSVMIIIIGIMPAAAAVSVPEIGLKVSEGEYDGKPTAVDVVTKKVFTVLVSLPPVSALEVVNMHLQFDNSVLKVIDGGAAYNLVGGDKYNYYDGVFVSGIKESKANEYAMGSIFSPSATKANSRDYAYVTFEVIDLSKESTTLNLYVNEFNDDTYSIDTQTLALSQIVRFDFPEDITEVETTTSGSGEATGEGESTTEASVSTITALINAIRELLKDNNASISDYIDAIVNILGNADIADMIEQLIGGNINIGDGFLEWIKGLGLDFGALEDILNQIIEFLKNLFGGGGDDTPGTTSSSKLTTNAIGGDPATTSAGSQTGSENTGDASIALAATVCVAAAAAFVLTRKKKED